VATKDQKEKNDEGKQESCATKLRKKICCCCIFSSDEEEEVQEIK